MGECLSTDSVRDPACPHRFRSLYLDHCVCDLEQTSEKRWEWKGVSSVETPYPYLTADQPRMTEQQRGQVEQVIKAAVTEVWAQRCGKAPEPGPPPHERRKESKQERRDKQGQQGKQGKRRKGEGSTSSK